MSNENDDCIIGLLHNYDYSELVTIDMLKEHIADNIEFNKSLDDDPLLRNAKEIRAKVWTLKNYGDWRKRTNLTRFNCCPKCGKTIDWKKIRGMEDGT